MNLRICLSWCLWRREAPVAAGTVSVTCSSCERYSEPKRWRSLLRRDVEIGGEALDFVMVGNEGFNLHGAAALGAKQWV